MERRTVADIQPNDAGVLPGVHGDLRAWQFDGFEFDLLRGELTGRDGAPIALRPKAELLLREFLARPGHLFGREELMAAVWSATVVTDDSLVQCVGELRTALADRAQRLIRTVQRRGYRLEARVEPVTGQLSMGASASGRTVQNRMKTDEIAVLSVVGELVEWDEQVWKCDLRAAGVSPEELLGRVRHAVAWALSPAGDLALGLELLSRSRWLWESLNLALEGSAHLAAIERACFLSSDSATLSRYWHARAFLCLGMGFHLELPVFAARAVAWARVSGERRLLFESLTTLAILSARSGNLFLAEASLAEASDAAQSHLPSRLRATSKFAAAEFYEAQGRLDLARQSQCERLALLRDAGAWSTELHARAQMLAYDTASGCPEKTAAEASTLLDKSTSLPMFRSRILRLVLADALLALRCGDHAYDALQAALPLLSGASAQWQSLDLFARLWALRGDWPLAAQLQRASDECHASKGMARKPYVALQRRHLQAQCHGLCESQTVISVTEALTRALGSKEIGGKAL